MRNALSEQDSPFALRKMPVPKERAKPVDDSITKFHGTDLMYLRKWLQISFHLREFQGFKENT